MNQRLFLLQQAKGTNQYSNPRRMSWRLFLPRPLPNCRENLFFVCPEARLRNLLETAAGSDPALKGFKECSPDADLKTCDASITGCEYLVARTGTIVLSSAQEKGRTTSVYAPIHICIATTDQLVYDVRDGLRLIREKYGASLPSLISFASGPSRTADIEKTLVVGVHGPKEVYLFLVDKL